MQALPSSDGPAIDTNISSSIGEKNQLNDQFMVLSMTIDV